MEAATSTTTSAAPADPFDMSSLQLDFNSSELHKLWQLRIQQLGELNRCMSSEAMAPETAEHCRKLFESYMEGQSMHYKIPMVAAFSVLFLVGVTGNALVILSIALFPTMRSRTNIFLLNLAISDLLIFFFCLPTSVYNLLSTSWIFGVALCKLAPFLQGVSVSVSITSLASMSIKRYFVVRYPMTAKERMSNRAMGLWVAGIWLASVLLCSPIPAAYKLRRHDFHWKSSVYFCVEDWQDSPARKTAYTIFLFTVLYLVPLIAMSVFYSMLGRTLVSTVKFARQQVVSDAQQNGLRALSQGRVKVSKIMIALLLTFAVCWLPYHVVTIFADVRGFVLQETAATAAPSAATTPVPTVHVAALTTTKSAVPLNGATDEAQEMNVVMTTVLPICLLLGYANSAINPLCLAFISSKFKKYFRLILSCNCQADARQQREMAQLYSMYSRGHPSSGRHDAIGELHHHQQHQLHLQHQHQHQQHQQQQQQHQRQQSGQQLVPLVLPPRLPVEFSID